MSWEARLPAIATAGIVVALDQATKQLAIANIDRGEHVNVFFGLDLTNTRNTGVAFGALEGGGLAGRDPDRHLARAAGRLLRAAPRHAAAVAPRGLLLGGALGNLADRRAREP